MRDRLKRHHWLMSRVCRVFVESAADYALPAAWVSRKMGSHLIDSCVALGYCGRGMRELPHAGELSEANTSEPARFLDRWMSCH